MDPVTIGSKIRALRGAESQQSLAEKLEISKSALAMYERGERVPRDEVKIRIASHFNVSLESIFFAPCEHKLCIGSRMTCDSAPDQQPRK